MPSEELRVAGPSDPTPEVILVVEAASAPRAAAIDKGKGIFGVPSVDQEIEPSVPVSGPEGIGEEIEPIVSIFEQVSSEAEIFILEVPSAELKLITEEPPSKESVAPEVNVEEPPLKEVVTLESEVQEPPSQANMALDPKVILLLPFLRS